jgi:hypothetical protein
VTLGRNEAWVAVAVAVIAFGLCLAGWLAGGVSVDIPWAPTHGNAYQHSDALVAAEIGRPSRGDGGVLLGYISGFEE